jgi:hypothetical protein
MFPYSYILLISPYLTFSHPKCFNVKICALFYRILSKHIFKNTRKFEHLWILWCGSSGNGHEWLNQCYYVCIDDTSFFIQETILSTAQTTLESVELLCLSLLSRNAIKFFECDQSCFLSRLVQAHPNWTFRWKIK